MNHKKIWSEVGVAGWSTILRKAGCKHITALPGGDISATCPYHGENRPSFRLRTKEGYAKCFSGSCLQFESNPIKMVAEILCNGSRTQALTELRSVGLRSIPEKESKRLKEEELRQEVYGQIVYLCKRALEDACRNYTGDIKQPETKTINYLASRGIPVLDPNFDIESLPIGILPSKDSYAKYGINHADKVHEFFSGWLENNLVTFKGALVFFYFSSPTEYSGFRIRYEFLNPKRWTDKQIKSIGPKDSSPGFFGLQCFSGIIGNKGTKKEALVVEGEFDLLSQYVHYLRTGIGYDTILCTQGSGVSSLDSVKNFGIDNLYLCLDNHKVDKAARSLIKGVLKSTEVRCKIFNWPFSEKDPSAVIETRGWEPWLEAVQELDSNKRRLNFSDSCEFLLQEFKYHTSFPITEVREAVERAGNLGAHLKHPIDKREFTKQVCNLIDVPRGEIYNHICSKEDTEEGFISRCSNELKETYEFIGKTEKMGKTQVTLWNRATRKLKTIDATKGAVEFISSISMDLGAPIQWAKNTVGIPDFIKYQGTGKSKNECSFIVQNRTMKGYLEMAMNNILSTLPATQQLYQLGQGSHYIKIKDGSELVPAWVIINGDEAYLGKFTGETLHFTEITQPRIGKYYFNLEADKKWANELNTVDDLNVYCNEDTCPVTLEECYEWLVDHLNKCWVMEEGYHGMQYLAAAIILTNINTVLPRQLYTIINGKHNTGKSAFMNLLGAGDDPKYRILECVHFSDGYTAAGFLQEMSHRSGARAFDEFEISPKEKKKTAAVNGILGHLRGLIGKQTHKVVQGSQTGRSVDYLLKCCIWACSIESLQQPADISRFVRFRTIPVENKMKQEAYILAHVGFDTIRKFRRFLTLGMFKYAPRYVAHQEKLYSEFLSGSESTGRNNLKRALGNKTYPSPRLLEASLLTGAILTLANKDPYSYVANFCISQEDNIEAIAGASASQELVSDILSLEIVIDGIGGMDRRVTRVRSLLKDPDQREILKEPNRDWGIRYIDPPYNKRSKKQEHWLIFMWPDLLRLLIRAKPQIYNSDQTSRLRNRLSPDKNTIKVDTAARRLGGKLTPYLAPGLQRRDISVYDISDIIHDWEKDLNVK